MKMIAEGNYCVVMMQEYEARDLLSGDNSTAEVFFGGLRERLGMPAVIVEEPSVEVRLERLEHLMNTTDLQSVHRQMGELSDRVTSIDDLYGNKFTDAYEKISNLDDRVWQIQDGLEGKLVQMAISQMRSMPADWNGRCEFGEAFTRIVELVYRNCRDGEFHFDYMGNRIEDDDE